MAYSEDSAERPTETETETESLMEDSHNSNNDAGGLTGLVDSFGSGIGSLEEDTQDLPHGAVPQVEPSWLHEEFIAAANPDWVLLKLQYADRLRRDGETAQTWTPDGTQVVTTSTIADERLAELSIEAEAEIVEEFKPEAHIGGDVAVYREWEQWRRIRGIDHMMRNTLWLRDTVGEQTTVLPVLKGQTRVERELVYRALEEFDHQCAVQYATQYFTGGKGPQVGTMLEQLDAVAREAHQRWGAGTLQEGPEDGEGAAEAGHRAVSATQSGPETVASPDGGQASAVDESEIDLFVVGCLSGQLAQTEAQLSGMAGLNGWLQHVDRETVSEDDLRMALSQIESRWAEVKSAQ